MNSFKKLKKLVSPSLKEVFDFLWEHYCGKDTWPTSRTLYCRFDKAEVLRMLEPLNGNDALISVNSSGHEGGYQLQWPGILCTSQGEKYISWLNKYLEYARDIYYTSTDIKEITHIAMMEELKLQPSDVQLLGKILYLSHPLSHGCGHTDHFLSWSVSIPQILEDMPKKGPLDKEFSSILEKSCIRKSVPSEQGNGFGRAALSIQDYPGQFSHPSLTFGSFVPPPDKRQYQVFISSTFTDLIDERRLVSEALLDSSCFPISMERFPAADNRQWDYIKRRIDDSDYYVVVVAGRYGTVPPGEKSSYTEQEFDYAQKRGIPTLVFVHKHPEKITREKCDTGMNERLRKKFIKKITRSRMAKFWEHPHELASSVKTAVQNAIRETPRPGWMRVPESFTKDRENPISLLLNE